MTTPAVSVVYDLHPPSGIEEALKTVANSSSSSQSQTIPTNATTTYPVIPSTSPGDTSATSQHYAALTTSLRQAQTELNEALTGWKDSIGDKEKMKEDPGTPGFGRGKSAMMSQGVMDPVDEDEDSDGEGEVA
jgi:hypothetical protein